MDLLNNKQTNRKGGKVIVRSEQVSSNNDYIYLKFGASKLDFNRWFGMNGSPFLVISKPRMSEAVRNQIERGNLNGNQIPASDWLKVHQTEMVSGEGDPTYREFKITASKLCNGDYNMPLRVEFYHYHANGDHKYKGETSFSINSIKNLNQKRFPFKCKKRNNKDVGD